MTIAFPQAWFARHPVPAALAAHEKAKERRARLEAMVLRPMLPKPVLALPRPTERQEEEAWIENAAWNLRAKIEARFAAVAAMPPVVAPPRWRAIAREVCIKHDVTWNEILSRQRCAALVRARQELMWRLRNETQLSFPQIAHFLGGRDHTTVLYGVEAHQARLDGRETRKKMARRAELAAEVAAVRKEIGGGES